VAVAKRTGAGSVSVYVSWNGATAVRKWQVMAGSGAGSLGPVTTASKNGFETRIDVQSSATTFAVRALGAKGKVLSTSAAVPAT
jgi:hypothetical protein